MKTSTRLALATTVFASVFFFFALFSGGPSMSGDTLFYGSLSIIVLTWAFKFILGSLIDKKAEPEE